MNDDALTIEDIIESVHDKNKSETDNKNENELEQLTRLELGKIIVEKSLDIKNIKSMTFLNIEQIDDILSARIVNKYFKVSEIDYYITDFMLLKRSEDGKLLNLFSKLAMFMHNENDDLGQKKSLFDRILKR